MIGNFLTILKLIDIIKISYQEYDATKLKYLYLYLSLGQHLKKIWIHKLLMDKRTNEDINIWNVHQINWPVTDGHWCIAYLHYLGQFLRAAIIEKITNKKQCVYVLMFVFAFFPWILFEGILVYFSWLQWSNLIIMYIDCRCNNN